MQTLDSGLTFRLKVQERIIVIRYWIVRYI